MRNTVIFLVTTNICRSLPLLSLLAPLCLPGELLSSSQEDHVTNVAVKILKADATRETREDFRREVKIMSSFEHENILKLLGIVPSGRCSWYFDRIINAKAPFA